MKNNYKMVKEVEKYFESSSCVPVSKFLEELDKFVKGIKDPINLEVCWSSIKFTYQIPISIQDRTKELEKRINELKETQKNLFTMIDKAEEQLNLLNELH